MLSVHATVRMLDTIFVWNNPSFNCPNPSFVRLFKSTLGIDSVMPSSEQVFKCIPFDLQFCKIEKIFLKWDFSFLILSVFHSYIRPSESYIFFAALICHPTIMTRATWGFSGVEVSVLYQLLSNGGSLEVSGA